MLSIFDDRIEFVSIGGLIKGITIEDMMLGVSITRNEKLANVFYRLALIEAYGTGVPRIIKSYEDFPVKPKFEVSENAFKITLPNKNTDSKEESLSEQEKVVVCLTEKKLKITRKDVEELLKVSQTMAGRILKHMVNVRIMEVVGKGKNTRYILKK